VEHSLHPQSPTPDFPGVFFKRALYSWWQRMNPGFRMWVQMYLFFGNDPSQNFYRPPPPPPHLLLSGTSLLAYHFCMILKGILHREGVWGWGGHRAEGVTCWVPSKKLGTLRGRDCRPSHRCRWNLSILSVVWEIWKWSNSWRWPRFGRDNYVCTESNVWRGEKKKQDTTR